MKGTDFRRFAKLRAGIVAVCGLLALGAAGALALRPAAHAEQADAGGAAAQVPQSAAEIKLSFAPVVKKVVPAVVNVYATRMITQNAVSPFFDDPFFRRFFGDGGRTRPRMEQSLGSGVIVDPDGTIVTNVHVIKDADKVKVALADRREFDADIVLRDDKTDLAVLKIRGNPGKLPVVPIGESDALEVGDIVLAVGNPFGVGQTVTQGIVSALARTQVGVSDYQFFIQTDAAINPGNSGGALVDMAGRLVGINTAIYSRSGGSIGIGFAIPSDMVRLVVDAARNGGVIRRPWLGATLQSVTADIADGLGLDRPQGALVTDVFAGGPAADAGLKVGDLVVAVDGVAVDDPEAFGYRFVTKPLGSHVALDVVRGGSKMRLSIALVTAPESVPRDTRKLADGTPFAGATVVNLSPAAAEELKVPADRTGVAISAVDSGSIADQVGFQPGDILVEINGTRVKSTKQAADLAAGRASVWRIAIERNGQVMQIALRG